MGKGFNLRGRQCFLETEYGPEWNTHFARPVADFPHHHRALTPQGDLAPLSVTWKSVGLVTTIHFPSPADAIRSCARILQAGRRRQRVRVELRRDGEWKARYQGPYVEMAECGLGSMAVEPKLPKPVRKDHNAGGRSQWMQGALVARG